MGNPVASIIVPTIQHSVVQNCVQNECIITQDQLSSVSRNCKTTNSLFDRFDVKKKVLLICKIEHICNIFFC